MATLIDAQYVRNTFNVHKDVLDARILPYIAVAERRLKIWVGDENFADAELAEILKLAEATLVMHLLVRNLNTAIRAKGIVLQERVEGDVTLQYQTPAQTEATMYGFLADAEELLGDLIVNSNLSNGFEIVTDESGAVCGDSGTTWGEWLT